LKGKQYFARNECGLQKYVFNSQEDNLFFRNSTLQYISVRLYFGNEWCGMSFLHTADDTWKRHLSWWLG